MNRQEIREWLARNSDGIFNPGELDHVSMCMEHIVKWYNEGYPLGDFLTAVVRNDFCEACVRADDVNRKALYLYAMFVLNRIGSDYIEKAKRGN